MRRVSRSPGLGCPMPSPRRHASTCVCARARALECMQSRPISCIESSSPCRYLALVPIDHEFVYARSALAHFHLRCCRERPHSRTRTYLYARARRERSTSRLLIPYIIPIEEDEASECEKASLALTFGFFSACFSPLPGRMRRTARTLQSTQRVHVSIYIYIYIYRHTYTHIYIHRHTSLLRAHVCVHTHTYTYV